MSPGGATAPAGVLRPDDPLTRLHGVGEQLAGRLHAALGLRTVEDLVLCFPQRLREIREVGGPDPGDLGHFVRMAGRIESRRLSWLPGRRSLVAFQVRAANDVLFEVRFFNQPYLAKAFELGSEQVVEGLLDRVGQRFCVKQGRFQQTSAPRTGPCLLSYPEVPGISESRLAAWIAQTLDRVELETWPFEPVPAVAGLDLPSFAQAVRDMHRPASVECHQRACQRFAILAAARLFRRIEGVRRQRLSRRASAVVVAGAVEKRILAAIPFDLTGDQAVAVQKIWRLMQGPAPMGLLLQGDVATGKTAVALCAALAAVAAGLQVAFLAPTELLAEQHWSGARHLLSDHGIEIDLLTANSPDRAVVEAEMRSGRAGLWFGTHALFSRDTEFSQLGLVIIDEQHRFGVAQRASLVRKGDNPHVLYLTATPIPRTLTLSLFGDLDLAVLRQRPPGRRPAPAFFVPKASWRRILGIIARRTARGEQVFVVCPKVGEDGGKGGAVRLHAALSKRFSSGLVHGQMAVGCRQAAVEGFRSGRCDVLVGTTVLEVGVDVPAATLMVVVGCDRFGLATLHQLRGRVGRGGKRGVCILTGEATPRTRAICSTTDGFELAEQDLLLRGAGEILGTRQSGLSELRALDPVTDLEILSRVRDLVREESRA